MPTAVAISSPPGLPVLGHALQMRQAPHEFLRNAVRDHGDAVTIQLGPSRALLLGHPDMTRDALVTNARAFIRGREADQIRSIVGNGLITSHGEFHRQQRRLAQPAFHAQRIAGYAEVIRGVVEERAQRWQAGDSMNMRVELSSITLRAVAKALFSSPLADTRVQEIIDCVLYMRRWMTLRVLLLPERVVSMPLPGNWRYPSVVARLRGIVNTIVAEYRAAGVDRGDLLSMLLLARDDETNETMTDAQLSDEAVTMILAGSETTAVALGWALWFLADHPEVEARLHAEIDTAVDGGTVDLETIRRLPYMRQVLSETLRLYSPAWLLTRRAATDTTLGGVPVTKGTNVWVSPYVIHRDPRWFTDPDAFDPDRWTPERSGAIPRHHYLPFGGGAHRCIGEPFAWAEAAIVLALIGTRWRFRLAPDAKVRPLATAVLVPDGLRMVPEPR